MVFVNMIRKLVFVNKKFDSLLFLLVESNFINKFLIGFYKHFVDKECDLLLFLLIESYFISNVLTL